MARRDLPLRSILALIAVTAVWGWTFVLVKDAIAQYPTLPFLAVRFVLAAAVMLVALRRLPDRHAALRGAAIGVALGAGYLFQTLGLERTSAGNAGLITGLFVVFTPLVERLTGRHVELRSYAAVAMALVGTVLLAGGGTSRLGAGDLLVVACAIAFALHIVLLSRWSPGLDSGSLALTQMAVCALMFTAGGLPQLVSTPPPSPGVWVAIAVTGVLASALAFFIQTWAQVHLSASRTAIVLATEPAWALAAAIALAGQRLGLVQAAGAVLLLVAIIGHEALGSRSGRT